CSSDLFHEHEVRPAFPVSLDGCAPVAALVHGGPERRCPPPGHAGQADDLRLEITLLHLRLVLFGFDGRAGRLRGFVAFQHPHASSSSGGNNTAASSGVTPVTRNSRSSALRCGHTTCASSPASNLSSSARVTGRSRVCFLPVRRLMFVTLIPQTPF